MPEGPGVDLLEVVERLMVISSAVMGAKSGTGLGAGSSGSAAGTGLGTVGKNRSERTWRMLVWDVAKDLSNFRRGGILLDLQLWCHAIAFHNVSTVAVVRLSFDHARLASVMVWHNALIAPLQDLPQVEETEVRAASQCRFHHRRPQKSGMWRHLKSLPETTYMLVLKASAAVVREEREEMSRVGNEAKSFVQEAMRESSIIKPGSSWGT